jgi:transcriptional repressor NrdR
MCPKCAKDTQVTGTVKGVKNERFRKCKSCGFTFMTVEAIKFDSFWGEYMVEVNKIEEKDRDSKS